MNDIMIGTWAWGSGMNGSKMVFGNKADEATLKESFMEAYQAGYYKWDTAAVYGMGSCERLLGSLIAGKEEIYLSTKYFPSKRYKKGDLTKSFYQSCENLGLETIDLFWIHVPRNLPQNLEEIIPLMKEGKIKELGLSNGSMKDIQTTMDILAKEGLKLSGVQNHFSLLRNDQQPIIDFCNKNNMVFYAYMVLEQGALSGHYTASNPFPAFSMRRFNFPKSKLRKIEPLLAEMKNIAEKYNIDASQVPILWAVSKGTTPIVGITKPRHAKSLAAAGAITLSAEEINTLDELAKATGIRQQGSWEPQ